MEIRESIEEDTKLICYHCGDHFRAEAAIGHEDHSFCCEGCRSVYQILSENDLCDFYSIASTPGKKAESRSGRYAVLDNEEIAAEIVDFTQDNVSRVTFFAPAIHCSSCIWLLENLHRIHPGIVNTRVNFLGKEVSVIYKTGEVSLRQVAELLASLGYGPQLSQKKKKGSQLERSLVVRLAVAGFCFGNSMLISLPDYLDVGYQIPADFRQTFQWINLFLALPVVLYSAVPYFQSAWRAGVHRMMTIDVPISLGILTLFARSAYDIVTLTGPGYVDSLTGLVFFLLIGKWYQQKTYQALSFDKDPAAYFPMAVTRLRDGKEEQVKLGTLNEGDLILIRNQELIPTDAILAEGTANIDYSFVTGESVPSLVEIGHKLYAGGRQMGEAIVIRLEKAVNNSYLGQLWSQETQKKERIAFLSDRMSRYFTWVVILLATGSAAYWMVVDPSRVINVFTSVLIVACPCALALAVPFTFGHTLRIFGRLGFYLKDGKTIEKLAKATSIVFDKTGTLTMPLPEKVTFSGQLTSEQKGWVRAVVRNSMHPLSRILYQHLWTDILPAGLDEFHEETGRGMEARIGKTILRLGSAGWVKAIPVEAPGTRVYLTINEQEYGYFDFSNAYRKEVFPMLASLKGTYTRHLLSGDTHDENGRLSPFFSTLSFKQTPGQKLKFIENLKKEGELPLMVGDGLNDAGALQKSYAGISISDDVYQFSPACDAILDARELKRLPQFLAFSKTALRVVVAAFIVSFSYNIVGLTFAVSGHLTPLVSSILMPVSSVTVVGFITGVISYLGRKSFNKE